MGTLHINVKCIFVAADDLSSGDNFIVIKTMGGRSNPIFSVSNWRFDTLISYYFTCHFTYYCM